MCDSTESSKGLITCKLMCLCCDAMSVERMHAPVSTVEGGPRRCSEEGICRNVALPPKRWCGPLKECWRLASWVWLHHMPLFSFSLEDRSRGAPRRCTPPTLGIYATHLKRSGIVILFSYFYGEIDS